TNKNQFTLDSNVEQFVLRKSAPTSIPKRNVLHPAFPNPFNPFTMLRYDLPEPALVTLTIYDMNGREINQLVKNNQETGFKTVVWNGTDKIGRPVSAGVYLYQIHAGDFVQTKKMVLLK
ncbi:MAG: T9SS type A sorting domain-containing protein, partial [Candidatus Marinimicrobia bacterium]|nr:T9SS type A sorting domain-containing protein [Candidatus Neomarinimicrobiota bacterium]